MYGEVRQHHLESVASGTMSQQRTKFQSWTNIYVQYFRWPGPRRLARTFFRPLSPTNTDVPSNTATNLRLS